MKIIVPCNVTKVCMLKIIEIDKSFKVRFVEHKYVNEKEMLQLKSLKIFLCYAQFFHVPIMLKIVMA